MRRLALLTAILLLGAVLRLHGLGAMLDMAHYDEAYYGVDALSLVMQPRLTPFFPGNFGRESLWMYLLAPALAVFGAGSFGLRIVAVFTGVLTLAAVYRLAHELIGARGAVWSMAALAVLFWHVLASHEAFRALLFPLVGALAFAFLWRARRTDRMCLWIVGGILLGALFYTYLAARAWLALGALTLVWWLASARTRRQRRGVVAASLITGVVCLPLLIYLLTNSAADVRVEQVAIGDVGALLTNMIAWLRVPFVEGPRDVVYNLPGRPLLDLPLILLFIAGIPALLRKRRDRAAWLLLLFSASLAPALLTTEPLRWLRAIGVTVPLALLLGTGAEGVERLVNWCVNRLPGLAPQPPDKQRRSRGEREVRPLARPHLSAVAILPAFLFLVAGGNTLRDFDRWIGSPDLFIPMEQHIYQGIDWLADHTPADAPVYFSPFQIDHPDLRLRQWRLGERPVGAFQALDCFAVTDAPEAYYFALTVYDPGFQTRLAQWGQVEPVYTEPGGGRYTIFRAAPHPDLFSGDSLNFGDRIGARVLASLPLSAAPGTTVGVTFGLRALDSIDRPYTLFVHLYQGAALDQVITLVSQIDAPICPGDPPSAWRADESIIQTYWLPIPADVEPGTYTVAFGVYDSESLARLPVGVTDFTVLQAIDIR